MSRETEQYLNTNTLIGFTEQRGKAWHYRAELQEVDPITGHVGNHYTGPIPIDHVEKRLFNWEAVSSQVFVSRPAIAPEDTEEGEQETLPLELLAASQFQAIIHPKTEQIFKIFKEGYRIHQYQETLLDMTSHILDDDLAIGSAGLLQDGARAWVSVEIPETIKTKDGVEFRPNLVACTSHDGTLATTWKRHMTMVVCDNTMDLALAEYGQEFKVPHTKLSLRKLVEAREALNIIFSDSSAFEQELAFLCHKRVTEKQWAKFLDVHIPLPEDDGKQKTIREKKRSEFEDLWRHDERVAPWKGTRFGVLQAQNTWRHHFSKVRSASTRGERNMQDALSGRLAEYDAQTLVDLEKAFALA